MLTDYLRDTMAALKWEIYEKQPITKRKSISENAGEVFRQFFIDQAKGLFTWQDFVSAAFKPRNIVAPEEAFAFYRNLKLCKENAFLIKSKARYKERCIQ